ncbi:hypothetical protein [Microbacterium aurugineum]|uniref:hypothetical protein n=1 Tax=Microbacterium aurugineum TaxID=2851642 RepID=UPI0020BFF17F|nr:hypothetical protein [Microbacterium aurugineum]MCK8477227.1 hypothetical protein [Microbacterium aurugineum]
MSDDFSELGKLVKDLTDVPAEANRRIKSALEYTSINLRDDWKEGAAISGGYPKSYAAAISYDIKYPGGAIESEIGPVLGKTPGASAGFLEEAGGGVDGPAHHAGRNALEANEPDFWRGLEIAATDALIDKVVNG